MSRMQAMVLSDLASMDQQRQPLALKEVPVPEPGAEEVLIQVAVCGVCHTDLDEIEGRLEPVQLPIILGHQAIGRVVEVGPGVDAGWTGKRVGVGWIHSSSGDDQENLSEAFQATGKDVAGGYAEYLIGNIHYLVEIPEAFADQQAAPLLCAGAIGYRSLRLTGLESDEPLGFYGFGGSGHLVLQLSRHLAPQREHYVFARSAVERDFALELGATWAGDIDATPPVKLAAVIDTTPAWKPIVRALGNLKPGGRLVINAIRKQVDDQDSLLQLSYHEHLWMEREIKSVANITGRDLREFMPLAAEIPLDPSVTTYPLAQANEALWSLKHEGVRGAKVLLMPSAQ